MNSYSQQNQTSEVFSFAQAVIRKTQGRDMRRRLKLAVDILLTICLVLLTFAPSGLDLIHKVAGIGMTALLVTHVYQHKSWFIALFRGRWSAKRVRQTVLIVLVCICMGVLVISGYIVPGTRSEFDVVGAMTSVGELHRFMSLVGLVVTIPHIISSLSSTPLSGWKTRSRSRRLDS